MKESYIKFLNDFNNACMDDSVKTIVIDTASQLWEVIRMALLQEKQEAQLKPDGTLKNPNESLRTNLLQIEYGDANPRMRNILYLARGMKKHLVMVNYSRSEYVSQIGKDGRLETVTSGKLELAGWGYYYSQCDIVIHTYSDNSNVPQAKICDKHPCGLGIEATGQEIVPNPTYDNLLAVIEAVT